MQDLRGLRRGRPNHCMTSATAMRGGNLLDGSSRLSANGRRLNHFLTVSSFADHAVVPESAATVVDPGMPLDRAALIGCAVLTGFGAVRNSATGGAGQAWPCSGVEGRAQRDPGRAGRRRRDRSSRWTSTAQARAREGLGATRHVDAGPKTTGRRRSRGHRRNGADHAFEAAGRAKRSSRRGIARRRRMVTVIGTLEADRS